MFYTLICTGRTHLSSAGSAIERALYRVGQQRNAVSCVRCILCQHRLIRCILRLCQHRLILLFPQRNAFLGTTAGAILSQQVAAL